MKHHSYPSINILIFLVFSLFSHQSFSASIDHDVETAIKDGGSCSFFIVFVEQADLNQADTFKTKEEKGRYVFDKLKEKAESTQKHILQECALGGYEVQPFWIVNMIQVLTGDEDLVQSLVQNPSVSRISANSPFFVAPPLPLSSQSGKTTGTLWNIEHVQAPEVWEMGFAGEGIVIGGQDTGYEWDHVAIKDRYRGFDQGSVNHDYNWHDAIHINNINCPGDSPEPCADGSHGTHTMGTALGRTPTTTIGVAPEAKWMACRNMENGWGTPSSYIECFEWFLAPTKIDGSMPDPLMAPDVMINSWACPQEEGCIDPEILKPAVDAIRAAGIFMEVSAGNEGPSCETVATPPAIYQNSFSVGAIDRDYHIAGFSSRGFVGVDGSYRLKPNISAPGVNIYSCIANGGYSSFNGTSMAGPHVAGVVALILSANPDLRGQVEAVEKIIEETALPLFKDETCGGRSSLTTPNPTFGHGLVQAKNAVDRALELKQLNSPTSSDIVLEHQGYKHTFYFYGLSENSKIYLLGLSDPEENLLVSIVDPWGVPLLHQTIAPLANGTTLFGSIEEILVKDLALPDDFSFIVSGNQEFIGIDYSLDMANHVLDATLAASYPTSQVFIPHIASNKQWDSTLTFFGVQEVPGSIRKLVFPGYGHNIALFHSSQTLGTSTVDLKEHVDSATAEQLKQAWVHSDHADLLAHYRFFEKLGPNDTLSARSPAGMQPATSLWIAHSTPVTSSQWFTGTALANPNDEPVEVRIRQFHKNGSLIDEDIKFTLRPYQQASFTSKSMYFETDTSYFEVRSSGAPILATHIFGTEDRRELCAIPAIAAPGWTQISGTKKPNERILPVIRELNLQEQFFSFIMTNPTSRTLQVFFHGITKVGNSEEESFLLQPGEKRIGVHLFPDNMTPSGQPVQAYSVSSDGPLMASVLNGSHELGMLSGFQAPDVGLLTNLHVEIQSSSHIKIHFNTASPCKSVSITPAECEEETLITFTQEESIHTLDRAFPASTCLTEADSVVMTIEDFMGNSWQVELTLTH